MHFVEDFALSSPPRRTSDGYLVADVRCARTGIQYYNGAELGRPDLSQVAVYRPETSVFSTDSLKTFGGKPITDDHPQEPVTSKNWKEVAVGYIGESIVRDGEFVRAPIILMDSSTIEKVESGKNQLSMGYNCELKWENGLAPDGTPFQAIQDSISINHIAVVDTARAGSACKIGDAVRPIQTIPDFKPIMADTKTILVDGLSVVTTEAGVQAIEKLQSQITKLTTDHKAVIDDRDRELAAKDAEIDKLKAQILDDAAIEQRVKDRAALIEKAKLLADADYAGLSDADIRKTAILKIKDAKSLEGKSDVYIEAIFDHLVESAPDKNKNRVSDQTAQAISNRNIPSIFDRDDDNGQSKYEARLLAGRNFKTN